ncbi:hypothetical protein K523DRAFT_415206 [Schizophyllum commune Tattone D]|nr:hypothetical protein K523DRAFT_415206 [Schizophyllum commune Tattone D]
MAEAAEPKYTYGDGDIVLEVEFVPYRIHSFHLQRSTAHFDKDIQALKEGDNKPITLQDVKRSDFESLLWFFYESAYKWKCLVDNSLRDQWESILLLSDKFEMRQVAIVASHALDRIGVLDDVRKISLCVKHVRDKDWALEELVRIVERDQPLCQEEGRQLDGSMIIAIAAARDAVHKSNMPSAVGASPPVDLPNSKRRVSRGASQGDALFMIEGKSYRLHSYHLKRASKVFADMYLLPKSSCTDSQEDTAITLDVKATDFWNLIWFFYDSAYEWTPTVPYPSISQAKWESVLRLADMFDMKDVAQVATYALDRCGALSDMRKIALCVRHNIQREWAMEALKNVCSRDEVISVEDGDDGAGRAGEGEVLQRRE